MKLADRAFATARGWQKLADGPLKSLRRFIEEELPWMQAELVAKALGIAVNRA